MATTTINWGTSSLAFAGDQRVYVRQRWADAWTLQSNIWCSEVTWSLLPSIPVAQLSLEYGSVLPHGSQVWTTQSKLSLAGWWVKIEVDAADGTLSWYGFIDESADEQGGITGGVASGTQRWVAYGPTQVLAHLPQLRSRWHDEPGAIARWSGSAIVFNEDGRPNRTGNIPAGEDGHMFAPRAPENQYVQPWSAADYWSTRDILQYLENYAQGRDINDDITIPFEFDNLESAPDWDRPVVETEGRSVLDIINQLINPGRLLQISPTVTSGTPDKIVLTIHSLADSELDIGSGRTHPENSDELVLHTSAAQDTSVVVQSSLSRMANQVILKGAKRQSLVTMQVGENFGSTGNQVGLSECFTQAMRDEYDVGASLETGYSISSDAEKKEMNQAMRGKPGLADVYRSFNINPDWDFIIGAEHVFKPERDVNGNTPPDYRPFWNSIRIAPEIPLKESFNYDTATLGPPPLHTMTFPDDHLTKNRKPYVLFNRPGSGVYLDAEKMANGTDPRFSCYVGIGKDGQAIELDVTGAPQHAIAYDRFTPLAADTEDDGQWTYFNSYFTIALNEDRFCEVSQPDASELTALDLIRRMVIYAGDAYQQIYVAPATIYDVNNLGEFKFVNKGFEVAGLRDNRADLTSLAELAYHWHTVERKVLRLVSARPTASAFVGQRLSTLNSGTSHAETINSVVTEISISMPRGVDLPNQTAQYSLVTAVGELDPLAFAPVQSRVV